MQCSAECRPKVSFLRGKLTDQLVATPVDNLVWFCFCCGKLPTAGGCIRRQNLPCAIRALGQKQSCI